MQHLRALEAVEVQERQRQVVGVLRRVRRLLL
jgi:hypothetical protein